MTDDGQKDTKPLPEHAPKDAPPDIVEGDDMSIEIPPGDDGLRSHVIKLTMRVTLTEAKVESMDARLSSFMTPQQIADMIKTAIDGSVTRVENLVNTVAEMVGDNVFDSERIDSIDAKLTTRAQNAAISDRKLDAVIGWINIMAARDVTDPDSKPVAEPYFDAIKRLANEANKLSLSTAMEFSQGRVDYAESMHELKAGIAAVNAVAAELKPVALSVARAQTLVDFGLRLVKRPRMAAALFFGGLAAFGGGAVLTPEVVKLIGNTIVSIFTGAN